MTVKSKKIGVILGARPNFVKAAPFFNEAKKYQEFDFTIIHTGQHFDDNMSKIFFDEMRIPKPNVIMDIKGENHTEKIGKMFDGLKKIILDSEFDALIVFGDVNSTLAGAIAAVKSNTNLIHIESGLRSHDRRMPEELNRVIVDHLSDLLFTTESAANDNLLIEGVDENKVKYVGNIMIESIELFKDKINNSSVLQENNLREKTYILTTIHRQENTDVSKILKKILLLLNKINKEIDVLLPLHPGTKTKIKNFGFEYLIKDIKIISPLGYFDFIKLMKCSFGVLTDSGGIQEETSFLKIPCCTIRDNTERPVTVEIGTNKLFPLDKLNVTEVIEFLKKDRENNNAIPLWDSNVSKRIFKNLSEYFK